MTIRLIDAGEVSFSRSQSIYHGLGYAHLKNTPDTIVLAQPDRPYMCIGHFQDARNELNLEYCQRNNLPVIQRETGGGVVYIDKNQEFVQWIFQNTHLPGRIDQRFMMFCEPLVETLKSFGINAYYHPINDIHVDGRKISGTGAAAIGNAEVVTGNFLYDFEYEVMVRALNVPGIKFRGRVQSDMKRYLTSIKNELGGIPDRNEVKKIYLKKCSESLGVKIEQGELTPEEIEAIEIIDEKFTGQSWVHQANLSSSNKIVKIHASAWTGQVSYSFEKGDVHVLLSMKDDMIEDISFTTEFDVMPDFDIGNLEKKLKKTKLTYESVGEKVDSFFGDMDFSHTGMNADDWIESIMGVKNMQQKIGGYGSLERQSNSC